MANAIEWEVLQFFLVATLDMLFIRTHACADVTEW